MPRLKVTQVRSKIGNPPDQRNTLRSLGLKRIGDVVVKEDRPEIRGMVYAVRHLIAVELRRLVRVAVKLQRERLQVVAVKELVLVT
jgi:large subunit ribosomal protein L30